MTTALVAQGLRVHPSATTFVLSRLPGERTGAELRRALLERHSILVRDAASFGLPHHIRLAARPSHDVERLVHALKQELVPGFTTNRDTSR
jgi:histidinol-phosphate/aromatic aminotransferase/cobyric acid decarboxylase-like protein